MSAFALPSGVGAAVWTTSFTESGSSLANWTQVAGSWSVVSSALHVDATSTPSYLKYNTSQAPGMVGMWCFEADVKIEASGLTTNSRLGLLPYWDGSTTSGEIVVQLIWNGSAAEVRAEMDGVAAVLQHFVPSPTWAADVYSKLRIVCHGESCAVILDGNLVGILFLADSYGVTPRGFTAGPFVGVMANQCKADFKNIKLSYLALP